MLTSAALVPVLETERLRLRGHQLGDLATCWRMWSDPEVTRFIGAQASSEQQTWSRLLLYLGHWALLGFGYWLVEERSSGAFVGEVGFADFKRDLEPSIRGLAEAGWALTPALHGKGYAEEALRAAITWGRQHIAAQRTVCLISPANLRSLHLAVKCGFVELQETTFKGEPTTLLGRNL